MWPQSYTPLKGSLALSALAAALPVLTLLYLLGVRRRPSYVAGLAGFVVAGLIAAVVYGMPADLAAAAGLLGIATALFPISWVILWAIFLYRLTVETGQFAIVKDSIAGLTRDQHLQALLIAFSFGAFVEGAAGFGTPVAVASAMLAGLGFTPFYAAGICLLANTAPVAFGSLGTPILMLANVTTLPLDRLSAAVGRICAPVSLFVPAYLVAVMGGRRGLRQAGLAAGACGLVFASVQLVVSNRLGPTLTDILGSIASMVVMVMLLKATGSGHPLQHSAGKVLRAWMPYAILVVCVVVSGIPIVRAVLERSTIAITWPVLDGRVLQGPPVAAAGAHYAAQYRLNLLSASGTACLVACLLSALWLRARPSLLWRVLRTTLHQLALPTVTVCSVLGLAFLMNYSGMTATLGLVFAATGVMFPLFSALLGWLGVFLTGSDTSANALFGNLQVVAARRLGLSPVLMAAANSSGGVMGKMISLQSIAVGAAATGMPAADESRLFRFTLRHSVLLAVVIGLVTLFYAYLRPDWTP